MIILEIFLFVILLKFWKHNPLSDQFFDQDSEDNDSSLIGTKYTPKNPPELKSKYLQFLEQLQTEEAKREVHH